MNLGNSLFHARKKSGLSQEEVAEKLGVSRQTISKWETGETLPDIRQSKRLALLYHLSLDELIDFDLDMQEIEQAIQRSDEKRDETIDWTKAWGKKYPILLQYPRPCIQVTLNQLLQNHRLHLADAWPGRFFLSVKLFRCLWQHPSCL